MKNKFSSKSMKIALEYVLSVIICLIGMFYVLNLYSFNIHVPYIYTGDGLSSSLFIKGMIENGWYNVNPNLGAPFGLQMYDYPLGGDNLQYLIMKLISLFNGDYVIVMNIYYLLTFPLCMITSLIVMRHFKLNYYLSISFSLLYTFMPYHIIRTGHLFLLGYYMVPLIIMVMLWLANKESFFITQLAKYKVVFANDKYTYASIIICVLIGSTGAYYAFFSCFFIFVLGFVCWLNERNVKKVLTSIFLILTIVITLLVNISPSIYNKLIEPQQTSTSSRNFEAAETYGLKITQLLLPTTNHNLEWVKEKKNEYNSKAPLVNENDTSSLGLLGSIGFLLLMIQIFMIKKDKYISSAHNTTLSLLNLSAVLLGTIGGLGVLFAALVSAQIRSYNRLSIFIAFFSFLFLVMNMDRLFKLRFKHNLYRFICIVVSLLIMFFGLFDQSTHPLVPSKEIAKEYYNDANFIKTISENIPEKSMVFQLPYVSFPEGENLREMGNYDLLKGYIHSENISWSFGNMKNSFGDRWNKELIKLPIQESIDILAKVGYSGIYIDSNGYTSNYMDKIDAEITNIIKNKPIVSENNELVFYDLTAYAEILKKNMSLIEWENQRQEYLSSVVYSNRYVISGEENWSFLKNEKGFKLVQTEYFKDLPTDQNAIYLEGSSKQVLSFDDFFPEMGHFSNRHWEQPGHFVISLSNYDTKWGENYTPSAEDVNNYFEKNNYKIMYNKNVSTSEITFFE